MSIGRAGVGLFISRVNFFRWEDQLPDATLAPAKLQARKLNQASASGRKYRMTQRHLAGTLLAGTLCLA
ncbi:MAG TPA: hypothetical protein VFN27_03730, partial [Xanthobacteraceae bacterium]|nr:hypothetical protein [Xanthobacteraceae bacterium]